MAPFSQTVYEYDVDEGFVQLQPPRHPTQGRKDHPRKVRFAECVLIQEVENQTGYSETAKSRIWYNKKDYRQFKDSCRRVVEWISAKDPFSVGMIDQEEEHSYFCARGLERYTTDGSKRYAKRFNSMKNDMLILRHTGARPSEVADLMSIHSAVCVAEALDLAREDAKAARRYQRKRTTKASSSAVSRFRHIDDQNDSI